MGHLGDPSVLVVLVIIAQNQLGLWLGTLKPSMTQEISCAWHMKSLVVTVEERTSAVGDVVWLLTFKGFVFDEERAENNKTKRYIVAAMIILLAMGMGVL
jgi:hypothetical protein